MDPSNLANALSYFPAYTQNNQCAAGRLSQFALVSYTYDKLVDGRPTLKYEYMLHNVFSAAVLTALQSLPTTVFSAM